MMLPSDVFILTVLCYQEYETGPNYLFTIKLINKTLFRLAMGKKLMAVSFCPFFIEGPH